MRCCPGECSPENGCLGWHWRPVLTTWPGVIFMRYTNHLTMKMDIVLHLTFRYSWSLVTWSHRARLSNIDSGTMENLVFIKRVDSAVFYWVPCRKANSKVITLTNHSRCKHRHEPIQIRSTTFYVTFPKAREKSRVQIAIVFGFPFGLVYKMSRDFSTNHKA